MPNPLAAVGLMLSTSYILQKSKQVRRPCLLLWYYTHSALTQTAITKIYARTEIVVALDTGIHLNSCQIHLLLHNCFTTNKTVYDIQLQEWSPTHDQTNISRWVLHMPSHAHASCFLYTKIMRLETFLQELPTLLLPSCVHNCNYRLLLVGMSKALLLKRKMCES